jgi:hypothetical protein
MSHHSLIRFTTYALFVALNAVGCASQDQSTGAPDDGVGAAEDDITTGSSEQPAILNGLRARVGQDFAKAATMKGMKIVFIVKSEGGDVQDDGKSAYVSAVFVKRNAAGKDARLTAADYKGSAFQGAVDNQAFDCRLDSPRVQAVLKKQKDGSYKVAKVGDREAYSVCPTDFPFEDWSKTFDVPPEWIFDR